MVIPALSGCLRDIQIKLDDDDSLDEICDDKQWFRSVMKRYSYVKGKELETDEFRGVNCFELAQMLMNESTDKSIKEFYKLTFDDEEISEDD